MVDKVSGLEVEIQETNIEDNFFLLIKGSRSKENWRLFSLNSHYKTEISAIETKNRAVIADYHNQLGGEFIYTVLPYSELPDYCKQNL